MYRCLYCPECQRFRYGNLNNEDILSATTFTCDFCEGTVNISDSSYQDLVKKAVFDIIDGFDCFETAAIVCVKDYVQKTTGERCYVGSLDISGTFYANGDGPATRISAYDEDYDGGRSYASCPIEMFWDPKTVIQPVLKEKARKKAAEQKRRVRATKTAESKERALYERLKKKYEPEEGR